jgi:hypothetical protein
MLAFLLHNDMYKSLHLNVGGASYALGTNFFLGADRWLKQRQTAEIY